MLEKAVVGRCTLTVGDDVWVVWCDKEYPLRRGSGFVHVSLVHWLPPPDLVRVSLVHWLSLRLAGFTLKVIRVAALYGSSRWW